MSKKIGLALGSGGLRGLAHVGVLNIFEQHRIPVDYVAGCSIGSLIGALFCSGLTPEMILKLAKGLSRSHWLDFVLPRMGIVGGNKILNTIQLLVQQKKFEELKIPLSIVATDLKQGKEVVFCQGDVARAVRASVSVPGIFVPYEWDGNLLVDGAVLNPTPIDVVRRMGAEIVIAVDLAHADHSSEVDNMFDVIIQSIDIMERELFKYRGHNCDILISPDVGHISPSSFDSIDECVRLGEEAALAAIDLIKEKSGL